MENFRILNGPTVQYRRPGLLKTVAMLVVGIVIGCSPALAGMVEVEQQGGVTFLSGGKIKNLPAGESTWYIFDTIDDRITLVDEQAAAYAQGNAEEYCGALTTLTDARMQQMSPEEREMMDQIMQMLNEEGAQQAQINVAHVGAGEEIAGRATEKYEVRVNGNLYEEIWLAPEPQLLEGVDIQAISNYGKKISDCIGKALRMDAGRVHPEDSPDYEALVRKGWVMRSVRHDPMVGGTIETEVDSLERRDIPEAEFQPPAEYQRISFVDFLRAQAAGEQEPQ